MECHLLQGEIVRLVGEKNGFVVRCTSGTIWLTCGDGRDYLLSAGNSFTLAAGLVAVAEALQTADCMLVKTGALCNTTREPVIRLAAC